MFKRRHRKPLATTGETSPASPASVTDFGSNDALNELLLEQRDSGETPPEKSEEGVDPADTLTPEEWDFWAERVDSMTAREGDLELLQRSRQRQLRTKRRPRGRTSGRSRGNRTHRYFTPSGGS